MKIGFIGLGSMAGAAISGLIRSKTAAPEDILACALTEESRKAAQEQFGIGTTDSNLELAKQSEVIILAVPSSSLESVLNDIREGVDCQKIVISFVQAGTLVWLDRKLSGDGKVGFNISEGEDRGTDKLKIVRALPNTPALVGASMTAVCPNENLGEEDMEAVMKILKSFGQAEIVPEELFDVIGTLTGTSPAMIFMMIESMADAAASSGLPREAAYTFAAQTVVGSASMALMTGMHPAQLRDLVCSPESHNTEAVRALEQTGFRSSVIESLKVVEQYAKVEGMPLTK